MDKLNNNMEVSDSETEEELDYKQQLEKNRKEMADFMASLTKDNKNEYIHLLHAANQECKSFAKPKSTSQNTKRKRADPTFKFAGLIPLEVRKSSRLQNKKPEFNYTDLEDPEEMQISKRRRTDFGHLEDIKDLAIQFSAPKKKRFSHPHTTKERFILKVEDVTEEMLNNISLRVKDKVYSVAHGTSCHQCRQKTLDQKTCCRNINCVGTQGQICGVCIINRYGETAREALLDPDWHCFKCRGICNCSICRNRQGKLPTGVLVPYCHQTGAKSVRHLLDDLDGKYDYGDSDEDVLGFSGGGRRVNFKNGTTEQLYYCRFCCKKEFDDPKNLLGFSDVNTAHMGGGIIETTAVALNGYTNIKQFTLFKYLDMIPA